MKAIIFWCKVNKYYVQKWYTKLKDFALKDAVLIWSCVVTDRAKTKFIKEVRRQVESGRIVYLTGCWVFQWWRLMEREKFFSLYPQLKQFSSKIVMLPEDTDVPLDKFLQNRIYTKHFLIIQNWCDNFCSFCLTIRKRWKHRFRSWEDIYEELKFIETQWVKEIVITGINLWAWGAKSTRDYTQSKLSWLLKQILKYTKIPRIRISSLGPEFVNDELVEVLQENRIMWHFHLSIQSFSNRILLLMRRNYDFSILEKVIKKLKSLKKWYPVSIGADIIVGFPGETEEDFLITYKFIKEFEITKLHAFPFSPHLKWETVPASKFPNQLSDNIKKERVKRLIELGNKIREKFVEKNKWLKLPVLVEEYKDWKRQWWTPNYIQVWIKWNYKRGDIVEVEI